ncbi:MAG: ABC transporter substrate-binding protein [Pseudomonadota bacterium]
MSNKKYLATLEQKLKSSAIDRRQFMSGALAAGLAVSSATLIADKVEAATPKDGGHIKFGRGHGSTTDSLDPATSENGFQIQLNFSYANCLTEVADDGSLIPELAESIEPSDDAKTWVFNLRKGVEFHNGKTLKAEDVIASINHHRGDESKSAAKGLLDQVVELKADGDDRVIFELSSGNADFSYIASDYHLLILPSKDGKVDAAAGVGTGGYKLENYEAGVRAELTRNPNYWKEGKAHFESMEILALLDAVARQNASLGQEVDVIDRVDPKTVNLFARAPHLNILESTGTLHYTFPMRLDVAPFDNYDLRMALKLSLKRQELLDKILFGHGALGNDHPISTANRYHASNLPQREFDPEKAAFHYKKSGHSGKIQLSAADAAFAGAVDAAQLIAASAKEAGIDVEVIREPKDGYWSNVWNKKGWCACYWGGRPTEDWMFSAAYIDSTEWNDTAWKTTDAAKRFNQIVNEARSELDENKRREMYAEAQTLVHDDGGAIVAAFANYIHALSKKVAHGEHVAANWDMDGAKAQERWWFA